MIKFDKKEAELSMRRIKVVLEHLPENSDILGLAELHRFMKSQTKIINQYALAISGIHPEENAEVMRTVKDILTKVLTFGNAQNEQNEKKERKVLETSRK